MKNKKFTKTLTLSKTTVSNLTGPEMKDFKGGTDTITYNEICYTMYKDECASNHPAYCWYTRYGC